MEWDHHMSSEGVHIPKAMGVHYDKGSGHNIDVMGGGPRDWVRHDRNPISRGCGVLGKDNGVHLSCDLRRHHIPRPWGCIPTRVLAVTLDAAGRGPWGLVRC